MKRYELADVELESPLINAAGSINGTSQERILNEVRMLADTAIGAITFGSINIPGSEGNEVKFGPPVYYHDPVRGVTYNSAGLPNIGLHATLGLMPKILDASDHSKPIIVSGSPSAETTKYGSYTQQAVVLATELLGTQADLVELDISCRNVVDANGERGPSLGHDLEKFEELIETLHVEVGEDLQLGVKLPVYRSPYEVSLMSGIAKLLTARRVFRYIVTANSIPVDNPRNGKGEPIFKNIPGGIVGMSGPITKTVGRMQLVMWDILLKKELDIVSALGVDSGIEVANRELIGANASSGVTFITESSNPKRTVTDMLREYAESTNS